MYALNNGKLGTADDKVKELYDALRSAQSGNRSLAEKVDELNETIDAIKTQDLAVYDAAWAVVNHWETPLWKDTPPTAEYINKLRNALSLDNVEVSHGDRERQPDTHSTHKQP